MANTLSPTSYTLNHGREVGTSLSEEYSARKGTEHHGETACLAGLLVHAQTIANTKTALSSVSARPIFKSSNFQIFKLFEQFHQPLHFLLVAIRVQCLNNITLLLRCEAP